MLRATRIKASERDETLIALIMPKRFAFALFFRHAMILYFPILVLLYEAYLHHIFLTLTTLKAHQFTFLKEERESERERLLCDITQIVDEKEKKEEFSSSSTIPFFYCLINALLCTHEKCFSSSLCTYFFLCAASADKSRAKHFVHFGVYCIKNIVYNQQKIYISSCHDIQIHRNASLKLILQNENYVNDRVVVVVVPRHRQFSMTKEGN